jgi:Family of unknown function (DUF5675)
VTDLILTRDADQADDRVTQGVLAIGPPFQTIEPPWVPDPNGGPAGDPGASCVPPGIYQLALHNTPEHPFTWALVNPALGIYHEPGDIPAGAKGRFAVLLHPGNTVLDSKGCIVVGLARSNLFAQPGVVDSQVAFAQLKALLPWIAGHTLTIMGAGAGT